MRSLRIAPSLAVAGGVSASSMRIKIPSIVAEATNSIDKSICHFREKIMVLSALGEGPAGEGVQGKREQRAR